MTKNESPKAVILAGGLGTRLHPFTFTIPKPLLPVGKDPIILHLVNRFKQSNVKNFLLAIGYQAELIKAYFGDGQKFNIGVKYFEETKPLGTAGPLALMKEEFSDDEYFFLINGDIYTEMDFEKMYSFGVSNKYDIVVGYIEKSETSPYGILNIHDEKISDIVEKPKRTFNISSGIYLLNSRVLKRIPQNEFYTVPDLINSYLMERKAVGAFKIENFWLGIEDVENMEEVLKRTQIKS